MDRNSHMPRGRRVQPLPIERSAEAHGQPAGAAARKRPLLLALVVVLLAGWLSFLSVLAIRG